MGRDRAPALRLPAVFLRLGAGPVIPRRTEEGQAMPAPDREPGPHGGELNAAISDAVTDVALELGLSANIVRAGASQGVMRIATPLTVTDAEIDLGVELLGEAVGRVVASDRSH